MSTAHPAILLPGDGIGPEVTEAAVRVVESAGVKVEWESLPCGLEAVHRHEDALPAFVVDRIRAVRVALKGPTTTPIGGGHVSANVRLRKALELFANVRPVKTVPGLETPYGPVDLVIVRENTEDLYAGLENLVAPGVVTSIKVITRRASRRIARFAFQHASAWDRKRVTAVHKANIMKLADGLFLDCCRESSRPFAGRIAYDEVLVDALCMKLVRRASDFDVLLLENLYGDIVSDLAAGLVGGLGLVPGANYGRHAAVFEAVHGSAPDIAGKDVANPLATILSAAMMLRYSLDQDGAAGRIEAAVRKVLAQGLRTADIYADGTTKVGTSAMGDAVVAALG